MRYDHFTMLPEEAFKPLGKKMTLEGGGGGQSQPAQPTQTSQVTIPEYAKPYMEKLLCQAEAAAATPYQTYGGERIAGPTAEQQAARQDVSGMGPASGYGTGMGMAGAGGMYGLSSAGAGANYMNMATDPRATQAFMSPYMQNVVDVQKSEAMRDFGRQVPQMQAAATRAGAFGGSRQAIVESEGRRNLGNQLQQIQAAGSQKHLRMRKGLNSLAKRVGFVVWVRQRRPAFRPVRPWVSLVVRSSNLHLILPRHRKPLAPSVSNNHNSRWTWRIRTSSTSSAIRIPKWASCPTSFVALVIWQEPVAMPCISSLRAKLNKWLAPAFLALACIGSS